MQIAGTIDTFNDSTKGPQIFIFMHNIAFFEEVSTLPQVFTSVDIFCYHGGFGFDRDFTFDTLREPKLHR